MRQALILALLAAITGSAAWAYEADDHWTRTATQGTIGLSSSVGLPATLTWSFAPDGTLVPNTPSATPSNLLSFLDTNLGSSSGTDLTARPWFPIFQQSLDRLSALSGLTFVYEGADDGRAFSNATSARGEVNIRGDIRIGGKSYGSGSSTLASNYGPDYGEMMINTDKASFFKGSANNYRGFRNTIMHEVMHGVGIAHVESSSSGFLIEPTLSTSFDGPQLDDILALQRLYGDVYEKNGDNNDARRATPLGAVTPTQSRIMGTNGGTTNVSATHTDFVSIDDDSDVDFFSFTLQESLDVTLSLTPQGTTYMVGRQGQTQASFNSAALSNLTLALIDKDGSTTLATANAGGLGAGETILRGLGQGTYFARVTGAQNDIQLYKLAISAALPAPDQLVWMAHSSNVWDINGAANFNNRNGADTFRDGDAVRFDQRAASHNVTIAEDVAPGTIIIATANDYVFSGPGGIIGGNVTISGGGGLELANSGNSYSGDTTVTDGTLKITGDAGAMVSNFTIGPGGLVLLDPTDAGAMASQFAVQAGGTLQIGSAASERNVFPNAPAGIANEGTVRIFDSEEISRVSGNGAVVVEQETSQFADNGDFRGMLTVKNGAAAVVTDEFGLGTNLGSTAVEDGGALRLDFDGVVDDGVSLAGDGGGIGALQFAAGRDVEVRGGVNLVDDSVMIGVESAASAEISSFIAAEAESDLTLAVAESGQLLVTGGVMLSGGRVTKRGLGAAELFGSVIELNGADIQEGRLTLGASGEFGGEYHVAPGAVLELADVYVLDETATLTGGGQVAANLIIAGTIAPGPGIAQLEITGDLDLSSASVVQSEAIGTAPGVSFDQLQILGTATLGGTLELTFGEEYVPTAGASFELLQAGEIIGVFDALTLPALDASLEWNVAYLPTAVVLTVAPLVALNPADFNGDGLVDAADLDVWQNGFGSTAETGPFAGDADGDLDVDGRDLLIWQRNLTPIGSVTPTAAVPEPTAIAAMLICFGVVGGSRRHCPR